jgi:valyl-tRNA synthetase
MPRFEARYKVVEKLNALNLFKSKQDHAMVLPLCSRSNDVLEPFLKEQWFVNASKVFKICDEAVNNGLASSEQKVKLIPESRSKLWNNYVANFTQKDWCISRQLWWGQRIPAFKCWLSNLPNDYKWFATHSRQEAVAKAADHFKSDKINIQQGVFRVRF